RNWTCASRGPRGPRKWLLPASCWRPPGWKTTTKRAFDMRSHVHGTPPNRRLFYYEGPLIRMEQQLAEVQQRLARQRQRQRRQPTRTRAELRRPPPAHWLRTEPRAAARGIGVDRKAGAILGYVVAQVGPFLEPEPRGEFDEKSLRQVVALMSQKAN